MGNSLLAYEGSSLNSFFGVDFSSNSQTAREIRSAADRLLADCLRIRDLSPSNHHPKKIIDVIVEGGAVEVVYRRDPKTGLDVRIWKDVYGAYNGRVIYMETIQGNYQPAMLAPEAWDFNKKYQDKGTPRLATVPLGVNTLARMNEGYTKEETIESASIVDGNLEIVRRRVSRCNGTRVWKEIYGAFRGGLRLMETITATVEPAATRNIPEKVTWPTK